MTLVALLTSELERIPYDNHKIVMKAEKTPAGQQGRCPYAPTLDEVAVVAMGENVQTNSLTINSNVCPKHI